MPRRSSPGVRWLAVDERLVVFVPERQGFVELDASGAELWHQLVEHGWDDAAAVTHLVDTHALDAADARTIVDDFVAQLVENGAVVDQ